MPDICIELPGAQFRRAYLLYVIEICHEQERYFYVGQTGDNNYLTARPAFRHQMVRMIMVCTICLETSGSGLTTGTIVTTMR